jgi:nicotinamide-nucleotide amidase
MSLFSNPDLLLNTELPTLVPIEELANLLLKRHWMMAASESCTGGMISAACTDLAGSSAWFERGFVTYSNAAKTELLGVDAKLIETQGAVSEAVVRAMVDGAISRSHAQVAVAVTGVAGPTGGSAAKPIGTVWFGWQVAGVTTAQMQRFDGGRAQVREATVQHALRGLMALLSAP